MQTGAATMENSMEFSQKTKNGTLFDPAIPLLGLYHLHLFLNQIYLIKINFFGLLYHFDDSVLVSLISMFYLIIFYHPIFYPLLFYTLLG